MTDAPPLSWERVSPYAERADTGHSISISDGPPGRRYSAWSPDQAPGVHYHAWPPADQARITYARGQHVPQRVALLGVFSTHALARACCARDATQRAPG